MALSAQRGRQANGELATSRSSSQSSGWFEALAEDVADQLRELDQDPALLVGNLVSRATAHVAIAPVSAVAPWALQKPDLRYPPPPPPNPPVFTDKMDNANVSADHKNGTCDPCVFFSSSRGCSKGTACRFCHLGNHINLDKAKAIQRPRKQTRDKYKSVVQKLLQQMELNPDKAHEELQAEANKSSYVRKLLQGYLDGNESMLDLEPLPQFPMAYSPMPFRPPPPPAHTPTLGVPGASNIPGAAASCGRPDSPLWEVRLVRSGHLGSMMTWI